MKHLLLIITLLFLVNSPAISAEQSGSGIFYKVVSNDDVELRVDISGKYYKVDDKLRVRYRTHKIDLHEIPEGSMVRFIYKIQNTANILTQITVVNSSENPLNN